MLVEIKDSIFKTNQLMIVHIHHQRKNLMIYSYQTLKNNKKKMSIFCSIQLNNIVFNKQ